MHTACRPPEIIRKCRFPPRIRVSPLCPYRFSDIAYSVRTASAQEVNFIIVGTCSRHVRGLSSACLHAAFEYIRSPTTRASVQREFGNPTPGQHCAINVLHRYHSHGEYPSNRCPRSEGVNSPAGGSRLRSSRSRPNAGSSASFICTYCTMRMRSLLLGKLQ